MESGFKSLSESYMFMMRDRNTYFDLWRLEQAARKKDKEGHLVVVDSYAKVDEIRTNEILVLKQQIKKQTRRKRLFQVAGGLLAGLLIYQSVK